MHKDNTRLIIFGATGTAGDGILKAAIEDSNVNHIVVVSRRGSPRIECGINSGDIEKVTHLDYQDYSAIRSHLENTNVVIWALGTSTRNVTKEEYTVIHYEYPREFLKEWLDTPSSNGPRSFHFVSGANASDRSWFHWAKEKARAETMLFKMVEGSDIRVIAYRPMYILAANQGKSLTEKLLTPFNLSIRSEAIGQAMLNNDLQNGTILENRGILSHSRNAD